MNRIILSLLLMILFIPTQDSFSKELIGKIYSERDVSRAHILPLLTDDDISFDRKSILRFIGGSLIVYKGTELKVVEDADYLTFIINKGNLNFKLDPAKRKFLFKTENGSVFTPGIIRANLGLTEGKISVEDNNSTIVEIDSGEMDTFTPTGISTIEQGQAVILTSANMPSENIQVAQGNIDSEPTPQQSNGSIYRRNDLPPSLRDFLEFIGEEGNAKTIVGDSGTITILRDDYGYDGEAKAVDFALFELEDDLDVGTPVKVVCASINDGKDNSDLFVRETDNLYPQVINEKNLLGMSIRTQTDASPHGLSEFDDDLEDTNIESPDEKDALDFPGESRSYEKWDTAIIDPETLQPDFSKVVPEDTDLTVICIRSTLVLQPVEATNSQYLNMVGKNAVAATQIAPSGKIVVDGQTYNSVLVDLNLQPKELETPFSQGESFTVVGVKEVDGEMVVLMQEKDEVLEELLAVGQDVQLIEDSNGAWGVVQLNNDQWWGKIVDKNFLPLEGNFPANTTFRIASIDTVLLANTPKALIAAWLPTNPPVIAPIILAGAIITPAIILPIVVGDDDDDDSVPPGDDDDDDGDDDDDDDGDDDDDDDDIPDEEDDPMSPF